MQQKAKKPIPQDTSNEQMVGSAPQESAIDPDDQSWFWTPQWQAGEAEADAEIARGELPIEWKSAEDIQRFFDSLHEE